MSVPAVAARSGWQSRRVGRLPRHASVYAALVALAAVAAAIASTGGGGPTRTEWTAFALLLPLAAVAPWFRVAVGRNHSFHTGPAFLVAGALVLPPAMLVGLVVALQVPAWSRDRLPWYIQGFNLSNYTLSALGAWSVASTVGSNSDASFALAG